MKFVKYRQKFPTWLEPAKVNTKSGKLKLKLKNVVQFILIEKYWIPPPKWRTKSATEGEIFFFYFFISFCFVSLLLLRTEPLENVVELTWPQEWKCWIQSFGIGNWIHSSRISPPGRNERLHSSPLAINETTTSSLMLFILCA